MDTIKQVFAVFGKEVPDRSSYSATSAKPFPTLDIMKEFKTWSKFELAYNIYAIQQRTAAVTTQVIEKKKSTYVKKSK